MGRVGREKPMLEPCVQLHIGCKMVLGTVGLNNHCCNQDFIYNPDEYYLWAADVENQCCNHDLICICVAKYLRAALAWKANAGTTI